MKKILIVGHARHGKDTLAEYFRDNYEMDFLSSSQAANEIFIFEKIKEKYGYVSLENCFKDRVNRRKEWFDLITEYNKDNPSRLAKEILGRCDCYIGMRSDIEFYKSIADGLFDLIIWVDASERLPLEPIESMRINKDYADLIISNNGTLDEFNEKAKTIGDAIFNN